MADLPWFPFWAADFLGSRRVRLMDASQVGIYTLLLAHEWTDGPLPDDMVELSLLTNGTPADEIQTVLDKCFDLTEEGWVNERLEKERNKQLAKHQRRVNAGKKGAEVRWGQQDNSNATGNANATAMRPQWQSESESDTEELPIHALWDVWVEEVWKGETERRLTSKRRKKLEMVWKEHLDGRDDPLGFFRKMVRAILRDDWWGPKPDTHLPETVVKNEELRERWAVAAKNGRQKPSNHHGLTDSDGLLADRAREMGL